MIFTREKIILTCDQVGKRTLPEMEKEILILSLSLELKEILKAIRGKLMINDNGIELMLKSLIDKM